jgi:hypothetical protein
VIEIITVNNDNNRNIKDSMYVQRLFCDFSDESFLLAFVLLSFTLSGKSQR